jgi:hypothetical protein
VSEAVDDIHEKTAVWSPLYYGDIEVRVWCGVAFVQDRRVLRGASTDTLLANYLTIA